MYLCDTKNKQIYNVGSASQENHCGLPGRHDKTWDITALKSFEEINKNRVSPYCLKRSLIVQ